jgi:hypothetical protein
MDIKLKFKLELDIFNEYNLMDILFQYQGFELFCLYDNTNLYIPGCYPLKFSYFTEVLMSEINLIAVKHDGCVQIYTLVQTFKDDKIVLKTINTLDVSDESKICKSLNIESNRELKMYVFSENYLSFYYKYNGKTLAIVNVLTGELKVRKFADDEILNSNTVVSRKNKISIGSEEISGTFINICHDNVIYS